MVNMVATMQQVNASLTHADTHAYGLANAWPNTEITSQLNT